MAAVVNHQSQAEKFLVSLADNLMSFSEVEVDELPEGISILTQQGEYLLHYHKTTDQIWVSSPLSGAHHFSYQQNYWLCTRTAFPLRTLLCKEFSLLGCHLQESVFLNA